MGVSVGQSGCDLYAVNSMKFDAFNRNVVPCCRGQTVLEVLDRRCCLNILQILFYVPSEVTSGM
jgi:hypothetical protein